MKTNTNKGFMSALFIIVVVLVLGAVVAYVVVTKNIKQNIETGDPFLPSRSAPENTVSIPPALPDSATMQVKAFFMNTVNDPNVLNCEITFPVTRTIPQTNEVGRAALNELLKGPTAAERAQGYVSAVEPGVTVNTLSISNGVARVDFTVPNRFGPGGSCGTATLWSQITNTLKQFPTVTSVEITANGVPGEEVFNTMI